MLVALHALAALAGSPPMRSPLLPGQHLPMNHELISKNGFVKLHNQDDGNMVLQDLDHAIWSTKTAGVGEDANVELTATGVLHVVAANGTVVWTPPGVAKGAKATGLFVGDDCTLQLVAAGGAALWSSATKCRPPPPPPPPPGPPPPMRPPRRQDHSQWFVLGDWGGGDKQPSQATLPDQLDDASGMARYAREHGGLDFVVGVGDNFYPAGVTDVHDTRFLETFENAYAQAELRVPWWHLAGNHDHRGNATAQVAYSAVSPDGRWNMPALWYTHSHSFIDAKTNETIVTQVVMLDTTVLWGIEEHVNDVTMETVVTPVPELQVRADEQLAWLEATLKNSTADYLWLAGHYPIYDPKSVDPRKRSAFVPLMQVQSGYNRPCAHQYVGKYQSCMVEKDCTCRSTTRRATSPGTATRCSISTRQAAWWEERASPSWSAGAARSATTRRSQPTRRKRGTSAATAAMRAAAWCRATATIRTPPRASTRASCRCACRCNQDITGHARNNM